MPDSRRVSRRNIFKAALFSRRQFFQRVGIGLWGAVVGSIALSSACKNSSSSLPATSGPVTTSLPSPAVSSFPTISPAVSPGTSPGKTSTVVPADTAGYIPYQAPSTAPALLKVPETECTVATDRVYSMDHIWVKTIAPDLAVMGVTPSFVKLIYPFRLSLFNAGANVPQNDTFGQIEGYKTTADLITPAAGRIMETNQYLIAQGKSDTIPLLDSGPFVGGWMIVMKLNNPDELKGLMTPQSYVERVLKMK